MKRIGIAKYRMGLSLVIRRMSAPSRRWSVWGRERCKRNLECLGGSLFCTFPVSDQQDTRR